MKGDAPLWLWMASGIGAGIAIWGACLLVLGIVFGPSAAALAILFPWADAFQAWGLPLAAVGAFLMVAGTLCVGLPWFLVEKERVPSEP